MPTTTSSVLPRYTTRTMSTPSVPTSQGQQVNARNLDQIVASAKYVHMGAVHSVVNGKGAKFLPILPVGTLYGFLDCGATSSFTTYKAVNKFQMPIIGQSYVNVNTALNTTQLVQFPVALFDLPGVGPCQFLVADTILEPVDTSRYCLGQFFPGIQLPKLEEITVLDFLFANDIFGRLVHGYANSPIDPNLVVWSTKLGPAAGGANIIATACQNAVPMPENVVPLSQNAVPMSQNAVSVPQNDHDNGMSQQVSDFFSLAALGLGEEQIEKGNNFLKKLALSYNRNNCTYTVRIPWNAQMPTVQTSLWNAQ